MESKNIPIIFMPIHEYKLMLELEKILREAELKSIYEIRN